MFFENFRKVNDKIIIPKFNLINNSNTSISKINLKNNDYESIRKIVLENNNEKEINNNSDKNIKKILKVK